ncbi:MAG TPA: NAD(P)-binding domain-containing protein [Vicinamibacterales bacterium]|nr:NAD(P)-binding domain-containing protein [Vicinamibacterales bacterium]
MPFVAIIGSGPLGGAIAQKLATRDRVSEVRLIDEAEAVASGKALDIQQSAPVDGFSARVTAAQTVDAAAGAAVIVLADSPAGAEHTGEAALGIVRRIARAGGHAPIVFGGALQAPLIARAAAELRVERGRLVGSAPAALESALRALAALALDGAGTEIALRVLGVPPRSAVVAWESASLSGQPLTARVPAHVLAGLSARIPGLWPPGPYALASAAARTVEAIVHGSRRHLTCFVALEAGPIRNALASMPAALGPEGVRRIVPPVLSRQEQTLVENAMEAGALS